MSYEWAQRVGVETRLEAFLSPVEGSFCSRSVFRKLCQACIEYSRGQKVINDDMWIGLGRVVCSTQVLPFSARNIGSNEPVRTVHLADKCHLTLLMQQHVAENDCTCDLTFKVRIPPRYSLDCSEATAGQL